MKNKTFSVLKKFLETNRCKIKKENVSKNAHISLVDK